MGHWPAPEDETRRAGCLGPGAPIPIPGTEFVLPMDNVVLSIGTTPNPLLVRSAAGLQATKKGCLTADAQTGLTSRRRLCRRRRSDRAATVILAAARANAPRRPSIRI